MMKLRYGLLLVVLIALLLAPSAASAQKLPDPEAWVDDLTREIAFTVDGLWYDLLLLHAQVQWFVMKVFFILGIVIDLVTAFLSQQAFAPLITQSNGQLGVAVSMSFTIAMLVLGMSYMIAHFIRLNVVEFRSALLWYVVVGLFFQLGPDLYLGMNSLRSDIHAFFYAGALESLHNSGSPLAPLHDGLAADAVPMLPPCDNFGWMDGEIAYRIGQDVDGLDIAMAYLLATPHDVLGKPPAALGNCSTVNPGGYPPDLPFRWYHTGGYFDTLLSPPVWEFISKDQQEAALDRAAAGQYRLIGAWPLLWLGIFEKIVYLMVTYAQGLSFISFGVAAIFAFFKRTEAIARSVVDLWVEIIITSVIISLAQALVVSLALAAAATQNPLASIGVGLLCAVLMAVLMFSALKLVWNAATRIFGAISQATGGAIMTPAQVATGATVGAVGVAAAVVTGGGSLALMGAAMAGMSASGIGGHGMSMAGGQLMAAGRSMGGVSRMAGGSGSPNPTPTSALPETVAQTALETDSLSAFALPTAQPAMTGQPAHLIPAFDEAVMQPDSSLGRRTSRLEGQFTPLDTGGVQAMQRGDHTHEDAALHSAMHADNRRDEHVAHALMEADNTRDDAALRENLRTQASQPSLDTASLERAARELSSAANSLKTSTQQGHQDQVMGRLDIAGRRNTGAVFADAVDIEREYRQKMNKPLLEGAGETFTGRMAQAVGVQPQAGQSPVSEAARFNAIGDQALRLGLTGGQVMTVLKAQASSEDGRSLPPELREKLVGQVQQTTGASQRMAQYRVGQFLNVAAAMPDEVRVTGAINPERLKEGNQPDEN